MVDKHSCKSVVYNSGGDPRRGTFWVFRLVEEFDVLGWFRVRKELDMRSGVKMTLQQGMRACVEGTHMHHSEAVRLEKLWERMVSHAYSLASNGSMNWSWMQTR